MRLLVTGGAGFIGSNFVRFWAERHPDDGLVVLDALTYAGNRATLAPLEAAGEVRFVRGDIANQDLVEHLLDEEQITTIVNFAAESHNSLAILDPARFFRTNVLGTQALCDAARRIGVERFHHISTCEVYGDLALDSDESFREDSPYRPRTPYNAAKAGSDHVVRAYAETFGLRATITNCCNNYGPYQFPEKVIPVFISQALAGEPLTLYASTENRREWLHVSDHCAAIELVLLTGSEGETYHVGSGREASITEVANAVLDATGRPRSLKQIIPDRPSHDRRYLLDSMKIRKELGWQPTIEFEEGLRATVAWYAENEAWWRPLLDRAPVVEGVWGTERPQGQAVRVLVTGAGGQLGSEVVIELERRRAARQRGPALEVIGADHSHLDVRDRDAVFAIVTALQPDVIIHTAAFTAVDRCETEPETAFAINAFGTRHLADAAALVGAHLAYVSTDYVFDGSSPVPYTEWDLPNPLSVYGRSKLGGERELAPGATIVRTSWVFGRTGSNMVKTVLRLLDGTAPLRFVDDQFGSPTLASDLAEVLVELALGRRRGIFHVTNSEATNWFGFVRAIVQFAGGDVARVEPIPTAELDPPRPAPRPANSVLEDLALRLDGHAPLRPWQDATRVLVADLTSRA